MSEIDDLLGLQSDDSSSTQGDSSGSKQTNNASTTQVVEINGAKYDLSKPEDIARMQKDYANLDHKIGSMAHELDVTKRSIESKKTDDKKTTELTPEQIAATKEALKKEFGVVTEDELDRREYTREANASLDKLVEKYGINKDEFAKELYNYGVRIDPSKFEKIWVADHTEEYMKWKKERMSKDQPSKPYTQRPVKEGIDLPAASRPRFGDGSIVTKALELIGHPGE